ncbi:MAG: hypothetical protein AAFX93_08925 [Verrucomicrobiota bacterium]
MKSLFAATLWLLAALTSYATPLTPEEYGRIQLQEQLAQSTKPDAIIETAINNELAAEAFRIETGDGTIQVTGGDEIGVMYGLLDTADQLRLNGGQITEIVEKMEMPRFPFRAVKFNLPWSAYRDHAVVRPHMQTCRDLVFWEEFLDMMAANRFNRLTLWNLHPFPYMFRPTSFPEATDLTDEELAEWKIFWERLFEMAHERGIKTYMVWWNIFVSPEFSKAHGNIAQYSQNLSFFGGGEHNELINRYNRECVTQLINEYPNLDGIGISLGERMYHIDEDAREQWVLDVIVEGMRDADRQVEFIHRAPFTPHAEVTRQGIESLTDFEKPIWVEFKFNASHGHSAVELAATHGGHVNPAYWEPAPTNYQMTWMMRNEDFVMLRWGQPQFIRDHIAENGQDYVGGYFVGSETYIPAVEYMQKEDDRMDWTYAFERDWLFYKVWGQLLFNPETDDQIFIDEYIQRYGEKNGPLLFSGMAEASKTPLLICSYLRGGNDPSLTAEQLLSSQVSRYKTTKSVFIDVNQFINFPTLDPAFINIEQYIDRKSKDQELPEGTVSPLDVAERAEAISKECLAIVNQLEPDGSSMDFEIADIEAWGLLARYFGLKIRAATSLQTFRVTGDIEQQAAAIAYLEEALVTWKELSEVTDAVYNEVESAKLIWIEKPKLLSWKAFIGDAEYDIEIASENIQTQLPRK